MSQNVSSIFKNAFGKMKKINDFREEKVKSES